MIGMGIKPVVPEKLGIFYLIVIKLFHLTFLSSPDDKNYCTTLNPVSKWNFPVSGCAILS